MGLSMLGAARSEQEVFFDRDAEVGVRFAQRLQAAPSRRACTWCPPTRTRSSSMPYMMQKMSSSCFGAPSGSPGNAGPRRSKGPARLYPAVVILMRDGLLARAHARLHRIDKLIVSCSWYSSAIEQLGEAPSPGLPMIGLEARSVALLDHGLGVHRALPDECSRSSSFVDHEARGAVDLPRLLLSS
jgi:hypothetical protein